MIQWLPFSSLRWFDCYLFNHPPLRIFNYLVLRSHPQPCSLFWLSLFLLVERLFVHGWRFLRFTLDYRLWFGRLACSLVCNPIDIGPIRGLWTWIVSILVSISIGWKASRRNAHLLISSRRCLVCLMVFIVIIFWHLIDVLAFRAGLFLFCFLSKTVLWLSTSLSFLVSTLFFAFPR